MARSKAEIAQTLVDYVEHGGTQQADATFSVPARHYIDPQRHAQEIEQIFKKLPLLLGLSQEVAKPGDFKTLDLAGLPLLVARGADAKIRVFLNVCPHRGNILTTEERGACARFTCIYHGWTFANDGRLFGVSDADKFGAFDKAERNLRELPSQERGGMIFGALTPGAAFDIDAFYGGMLTELESFKFDEWHYAGRRVVPGPNWKVAYDGYIESYHFATAHPNTVTPYVTPNISVFDSYGPHVRVGSASTKILSQLKQVPKNQWEQQEGNGFEFIRAVFPNAPIFVGPQFAQFPQVLPGPAPTENTTILTYLSRRPAKDDEQRAQMDAMIDFFANTLATEDYAIGFDVQKGLASGAVENVLFGRNEAANHHFHRYVDYYLSLANSAEPPEL